MSTGRLLTKFGSNLYAQRDKHGRMLDCDYCRRQFGASGMMVVAEERMKVLDSVDTEDPVKTLTGLLF